MTLSSSSSRALPAAGFTPSGLTRREQEVLNDLLENFSNKEIAKRLRISERTAKFHVSNVLAKYGVRRRADLILLSFTDAKRG
jgi:DNA-binding NarL/FixJ family response regulator